MAFTLKKVINGEEHVFTVRKFLELMGDIANDEIILDGEIYRISSFLNMDSGSGTGTGYVWQIMTLSVSQSGQETVTLTEAITETISLQLIINGVAYAYGSSKSYHISQSNLYWHGGFDLDPMDTVYLKYLKAI